MTSAQTIANEQVAFDIVRGKKVVGFLEANKTVKKDRIVYTSYSEASMRMVKKITVRYEFKVVVKDDVLFQADARISVNGKLHSTSEIHKDGDQYIFVRNKKKSDIKIFVDYPIHYPAIMLLFQEPNEFVASFSEEDGHFHQLNRIEGNGYKKTNPKGKVNEYFYENGDLVRANLDAGFFQFKVVRRLR